ncbi:MAG: bifunctional nicotinamidase/pyrazinamidase [Rhodopirellula sp.]|nr:bifunctional nicotinamidase/pyrazinamidase [Rhodopirellula sp.]
MRALILVDLQNDFCPGGALPVPDGHTVVPIANRLMARFDLVIATQDWHPRDHGSFAVNHPDKQIGDVVELDGIEQILWPVHCVQDTPGAELHPQLDRSRIDDFVKKGTERTVDSYSGFFDNGRRHATGLAERLRARGVSDVYLCGLATEYCVEFTALDAADLGFTTWLVRDACRGIDRHAGDIQRAIAAMQAKNVRLVESSALECA